MAKKKKSRKKQVVDSGPKHALPEGFWSQIGALLLIALSLLFIVAWFNTGGPVPEWLHDTTLSLVGYSLYVVPIFAMYLAIETFRAEDNRLPLQVKIASAAVVLWFSGLFGLIKNSSGEGSGGALGDFMNGLMLSVFDTGLAAFFYVLLLLVTMLFITRVSPFTIFSKIWSVVRSDSSEQESNSVVMKNASNIDASNNQLSADFKVKLNGPQAENKKLRFPAFGKTSNQTDEPKAEDKPAAVAINDPNWEFPSIDLLDKSHVAPDPGDIQGNAKIIQETLAQFDINVAMDGGNVGPKVTQYTLKPPSGVKLAKITSLESDLALSLAAPTIRIEAPIPGQSLVGIEVPNRRAEEVRLRSMLVSKSWINAREPLSFPLGKNIPGSEVIGELNKMPHILIAGTTGAGKSVMINSMLVSLLYRNKPSDMKLILVDPKQVELAAYRDIPHLLTEVITTPEHTVSALKWAVGEMESRYKMMLDAGVQDIASYNKKLAQKSKNKGDENEDEGAETKLPYIVIVIDELADLMFVAGREIEALIVRLAQKGRASGVHLILATQRPSVNVITGLIKANVPARIAFTVPQMVDSRTIIDRPGAEKLLGSGDMLFIGPNSMHPQRIQGAFISRSEIDKVVAHVKMQAPPQYNEEVTATPVQFNGRGGVVIDHGNGTDDPKYDEAVRFVIENGQASTSLLQRRLRLGYGRASRFIDIMEEQGIISAKDGSRPREVLVSSIDDLDI